MQIATTELIYDEERQAARPIFSKPRDFEWSELKALLKGLGFEEVSGTGSRIKFHDLKSGRIINLHRPHPRNVVKQYVLDRVIEELKDRGIRP